ncbi:MAG: MotA/TolQ/ExbB proton channel family protein [Kiloniellales bacterium]
MEVAYIAPVVPESVDQESQADRRAARRDARQLLTILSSKYDVRAADPRRSLLVLRFALVNIAGFAMVAAAHSQGLIAPIFASDSTYLSHLIVGVFLVGLCICAIQVWQTSNDLDAVRAFDPGRPSRARGYLNLISNSAGDSRSILASSLKLKLSQRIVVVRQFSSSLVLLGLIGTVIGFVMALAGVNPETSGDVRSIAPMVSSLIDGMHTALYTTLVGSLLHLWLNATYQLLATGTVKLITALVEFGEAHARP